MPNELADLLLKTLDQYKVGIEQRLREQIVRHHRIDPTIERKRVVEIQIRQERERMEHMADNLEEEGQDEAAGAMRDLAEDWLDDIEDDLKSG